MQKKHSKGLICVAKAAKGGPKSHRKNKNVCKKCQGEKIYEKRSLIKF